MNDRIVSITFPKCGTCQYAQPVNKHSGLADCYGMPPTPMILGATQGPLGPQIQMEVFSPKVKEDRPACSLYHKKEDFVTAGRS